MESTETTKMSSRQPPLHTCGVVILSIAHRAYTRSQNFNGPIGSIVRKTARLVELGSPLICALQYRWLAILYFADDLILSLENAIETLFPSSKRAFNNIDKLVQVVETLPGKFDDAMNKFSVIMNQESLLDQALVKIMVWLNFWISRMTHLGYEIAKEKEIQMDSNTSENQPILSPRPQSQEAETDTVDLATKQDIVKGTYKQAVVNGRKASKGDDMTMPMTMKETQKQVTCEEERGESGNKLGTRSDENLIKHDPILELFDSGWLMKPGTGRSEGKENWLSRSVSDA